MKISQLLVIAALAAPVCRADDSLNLAFAAGLNVPAGRHIDIRIIDYNRNLTDQDGLHAATLTSGLAYRF